MTRRRLALITGANKGIGFETARQLGQRDVHVLLGSRDPDRGVQAARRLSDLDVEVSVLPLDVTDQHAVRKAAGRIEHEHGHLDILINNAGVSGFSPAPSLTSSDLVRSVYETNVFAVVTLTNEMLPLLRRSGAARIVNLSSHMGSLTMMSDPSSPFAEVNLLAYQSSKAAVNAITIAYARELRASGIKVNSANPGMVATDMNGQRGSRTPSQAAAIVVRLALLGEDGPSGSSLAVEGDVPW